MWRFTPLPDGGTPGGLPPAGRGTPNWNEAVYPLPDGVTPGSVPPAGRGNAGRFTPCRTGERRAVYPLPDGGTPGGLPPAGRGNAELE